MLNPSGGTIIDTLDINGIRVVPSNTSKDWEVRILDKDQWAVDPTTGKGIGALKVTLDSMMTSGSVCMQAEYKDGSAESNKVCFQWKAGDKPAGVDDCAIKFSGTGTLTASANAGCTAKAADGTSRNATLGLYNAFISTLNNMTCGTNYTITCQAQGGYTATPDKDSISNLTGTEEVKVKISKEETAVCTDPAKATLRLQPQDHGSSSSYHMDASVNIDHTLPVDVTVYFDWEFSNGGPSGNGSCTIKQGKTNCTYNSPDNLSGVINNLSLSGSITGSSPSGCATAGGTTTTTPPASKVSISTYSEWLGSDYMTCSSEAFQTSPNGTYNKGQSVKVEAKYTGGGTCRWTNCGGQSGYASPVFQGWYDANGNQVSTSQSFTVTLDSSKEYTAKWGGASCEGQVEETGSCTFNYDVSATGTTPDLMGTVTYNLECTGEGLFTGDEKITVDFANKSGFVVVYLSGRAKDNSKTRTIKSDKVHITGDNGNIDSQVNVYANGKHSNWIKINHVDEATIK